MDEPMVTHCIQLFEISGGKCQLGSQLVLRKPRDLYIADMHADVISHEQCTFKEGERCVV